MNKIILILFLIATVSCSKKNEIESLLVTNKDEYWEYQNYCFNNGLLYFQFNENAKYDKYLRMNEGFKLFNKDGDLRNDSRTWSVKNDSTLVWNQWNYKIEKTSKDEILLSYYHHEIKDKKCYIRLSKLVDTSKGTKLLDELDNTKN